MSDTEKPTLFLDVETQKLAQEVGGWHNVRLLRLAVAVTYNSGTGFYRAFLEDEVGDLLAELQGAGKVVGYNLLRFDYQVLQPYADFHLHALPTVDMLDHLHRTLGFRLGLDAVARATLGIAKSADGIQAVNWFRQGAIQQVTDYCRQDVEVTKGVYDFGREQGYVHYHDRQHRLQRVPVRW